MAPRSASERAKHLQEMDDAYRAIGRYVVAFAEMVREMRTTMGYYIAGGTRWVLVDMALGEAAAQQVSSSYFSLCRDAGDFTKPEEAVAQALSNAVSKTVRQRNDIAHGDWTVGALVMDAERDMLTMDPQLIRPTPREKKPYKIEVLKPEEIDARTDRLLALLSMVDEFGRLALKLPVYRHADDGSSIVSTGEFRVGDVFGIEKRGSKKDPLAVRTGPRADELWPRTYAV